MGKIVLRISAIRFFWQARGPNVQMS
jgi:hypothetical protein